MPPDLVVIMVSWNTRDITLDALRTLRADLDANGPDAAVWVVDNASTDGTPQSIRERFPDVTLIASESNLGFAGGNNYALRLLGFENLPGQKKHDKPKAVYLLNPDTRTQPGATRALYDALMSLPNAGVVGARLSYEDGAFQHSAFRFPGLGQLVIDLFPVPGRFHDSWLNGRYPRRLYQAGNPFPVEHTLGATMMLRQEVIDQTGLFDERYFMYCEEIDWSKRIRQAGWEIYCVPAAHVVHLAGQSTGQTRPQSIVNLWRSRFLFFDTYERPIKRALARKIVRLGMQRKIAETRRAFAAGRLSAEERDALIEAYRTVQTL